MPKGRLNLAVAGPDANRPLLLHCVAIPMRMGLPPGSGRGTSCLWPPEHELAPDRCSREHPWCTYHCQDLLHVQGQQLVKDGGVLACVGRAVRLLCKAWSASAALHGTT